jgi:hypothetical protein
MKKAAIIAGIILTTGVTTFALTNKANKTKEVKVKIENTASKTTTESANTTLATAD